MKRKNRRAAQNGFPAAGEDGKIQALAAKVAENRWFHVTYVVAMAYDVARGDGEALVENAGATRQSSPDLRFVGRGSQGKVLEDFPPQGSTDWFHDGYRESNPNEIGRTAK